MSVQSARMAGVALELHLKTALGTYPHTLPLKDGRVTSPRLCLEHVDITPVNRAFRPMVNQVAYDVSELALVTYLLARALDRPLVGVPVIVMQQSVYPMLLTREGRGLNGPRDLHGKTIGVRAYTQTTGVWLRAMLHEQFGLDLDSLTWLTQEAAHVDGFVDPPNTRRAPDGTSLAQLLRDGAIDAAAGLEPAQFPELRSVIPHPQAAEEEWIQASGVRPINHTLVVAERLAHREPWLPDELDQLIRAAKAVSHAPAPPDGLEANRQALETLARFAHEQHITNRVFSPEELFPV